MGRGWRQNAGNKRTVWILNRIAYVFNEKFSGEHFVPVFTFTELCTFFVKYSQVVIFKYITY